MQTNDIDFQGLAFIPALTLVFAAICYLWARSVRRRRPLTPIQKKMIVYASLFCLGMGFAMVLKDQLSALTHWQGAWVGATILWGAIIAGWLWLAHRITNRRGSSRL